MPHAVDAAFIGSAIQAKLSWFKNVGASVLHTLPFGFNHGDAMGTHLDNFVGQ